MVSLLAGRLVGWYMKGFMALGCLMLAGIVIVMGVQVFFRYVLNDSLIWAEELSRYLLVWISFLFLGLAYRRGELVAISFLLRAAPRRAVVALMTFGYGISVTFLIALAWFGFKFAEVNSLLTLPAFDFIWSGLTGSREPLDISAFWLYAAVPAGAVLLALHMLAAYAGRMRDILSGGDPFAEDGALPDPETP